METLLRVGQPVLLILGGLLLLMVIIAIFWKKATQDEAIVITGLKRRVITGGGGLVIPGIEQYQRVSLENIPVDVSIEDIPDKNRVPAIVQCIAMVRIIAEDDGYKNILKATKKFFKDNAETTTDRIAFAVREILSGKMRDIIAEMSIDELHSDRQSFSQKIEEIVKPDLEEWGIELSSLTLKDIDDSEGYLEALGAKQIADVKKNAQIAKAEAEREEKEKTSSARRAGREAELLAETEIARAEKQKELQIQAFKEEEKRAQAKADFAYQVEEQVVRKSLIDSTKNAELLEEKRQTEIAVQQAEKREEELKATVVKEAEALKVKEERQAEADKYKSIQKAEAEAQAILIKGEAEAQAIRLKGQATADAMKAEAEAMKEKAEAYKLYGEVAVVEMLANKLPEVAKYIAEPMSKIGNITVLDNGGDAGASKVTKSVSKMIMEVPEVIKNTTGVDIIGIVKNMANNASKPAKQPTIVTSTKED